MFNAQSARRSTSNVSRRGQFWLRRFSQSGACARHYLDCRNVIKRLASLRAIPFHRAHDVILPNGFTSTENVGDSRYIGFEAATELDILSLINGGAPSPWGNLTLYGNVTLLDAEFTSGPNDGLVPAYAPEYQVKTGAIYSYKNTFNSRFLARSLTMNLVTMAIPLKASSQLITFGISRPNSDSGRGELASSPESGTFSTRVIGARFARRALCLRCRETTTAGSNSFSKTVSQVL
jgi:hypothetical protein